MAGKRFPAPDLNPAPGLPIEVENSEVLLDRLYQLSYIRANAQRYKIIYIKEELPMNKIIDRCMQWCKENGVRFIWVERAIEAI